MECCEPPVQSFKPMMLGTTGVSESDLQQALTLFFVFTLLANSAFTSSVSFIITQIVRDKETKARETLKIMSMKRSAYMWSYFIVQSVFVAITSIILTAAFLLPLKYKSNEEPVYLTAVLDNPFSLFLALFLFGEALVAMSLAFSTMFQDSKIAG
jgi:putative exporter of polyketide antibiotics